MYFLSANEKWLSPLNNLTSALHIQASANILTYIGANVHGKFVSYSMPFLIECLQYIFWCLNVKLRFSQRNNVSPALEIQARANILTNLGANVNWNFVSYPMPFLIERLTYFFWCLSVKLRFSQRNNVSPALKIQARANNIVTNLGANVHGNFVSYPMPFLNRMS